MEAIANREGNAKLIPVLQVLDETFTVPTNVK